MSRKMVTSVHEEDKQFEFEVYDYGSSQKSHLNQHVATVHDLKKPFPNVLLVASQCWKFLSNFTKVV